MAQSNTHILAFDTSGPHVALALTTNGQLVGEVFEPMARGQAEALLVRAELLLQAHNLGWRDLSAIGVGIGPGNFTGIRISVSAARGLAVGLGVPAIDVSNFEVLRQVAAQLEDASQLVVLPAPRDLAYVQLFENGFAQGAPIVIDPDAVPDDLVAPLGAIVIGHRAAEIGSKLNRRSLPLEIADIPAHIAAITARKFAEGAPDHSPAPLYVRPADAAPPRDPAPVLLD